MIVVNTTQEGQVAQPTLVLDVQIHVVVDCSMDLIEFTQSPPSLHPLLRSMHLAPSLDAPPVSWHTCSTSTAAQASKQTTMPRLPCLEYHASSNRRRRPQNPVNSALTTLARSAPIFWHVQLPTCAHNFQLVDIPGHTTQSLPVGLCSRRQLWSRAQSREGPPSQIVPFPSGTALPECMSSWPTSLQTHYHCIPHIIITTINVGRASQG